MLVRDVFGDEREHFGFDLEVGEIDRRNAVLLGDELGEFFLVHEAQRGDLGTQALALAGGFFTGLEQLLRREQVLLDQQLSDPLVQRFPSPARHHAPGPRALQGP